MAMFLAQPKCASTRFKSWVANATFIGSDLSCCPASVQLWRPDLQAGVSGAPAIGRRLVILLAVGDHEIGDVEDQVAGVTIADREQVPCPEPIEHRKARAVERNVQPCRRLPAMRMGDQEVTILRLGALLEIF